MRLDVLVEKLNDLSKEYEDVSAKEIAQRHPDFIQRYYAACKIKDMKGYNLWLPFYTEKLTVLEKIRKIGDSLSALVDEHDLTGGI